MATIKINSRTIWLLPLNLSNVFGILLLQVEWAGDPIQQDV
jgi:hypothetical protein